MNIVGYLVAPLTLPARVLGDLAALAAFAREFRPYPRELLDRADRIIELAAELQAIGTAAAANAEALVGVGDRNARVGNEMVELARLNVEGNRETNRAMGSLDARMAALLEFTAALEKELPALRSSMETMEELSESASALSEAAPPVGAAAARVERIAGRIPGMRQES